MIDFTGLIAKIASHAHASGLFDAVPQHEPKSAPLGGLTASVFVQRVRPARNMSGLAATSAVVEFRVRIYTSMIQDPADEIDPRILEAVDKLFQLYHSDFTLGGSYIVDLLGIENTMINAEAGYITQDGKLFRVMDITLPVIVNDAWSQSP